MDEKIEEMAKVCCFDDTTCVECFKQYEKFVWKSNIKEEDRGKHCQVYDNAKRLYNAGYRKESDTARELAKTIKSVVWEEFENETIRIKDLHGVIDDILRSKYGADLWE